MSSLLCLEPWWDGTEYSAKLLGQAEPNVFYSAEVLAMTVETRPKPEQMVCIRMRGHIGHHEAGYGMNCWLGRRQPATP